MSRRDKVENEGASVEKFGKLVAIQTLQVGLEGAKRWAHVVEGLQEGVEAGGNEGADERSNPVDPVLARELVGDCGRTKGAGGVHATSCPERAEQLADEEGQANADGCHEGGFVLCRHEKRKKRTLITGSAVLAGATTTWASRSLDYVLSAASMSTVNTSMAVRKASSIRPWPLLTPGSSLVIALLMPPIGVRTAMRPEPAHPPAYSTRCW